MDLSIIKHLKKKKNLKLAPKQQQLFIQLLADLLFNGFTIQESLLFMQKSRSISKQSIDFLIQMMERGENLTRGLVELGFKPIILTQIEFAQIHGDLAGTLKKIKQHLRIVEKQRQSLYKVLSYPLLLLLFLLVVLISIRQLLLPQLMANGTVQANNVGISFIQKSPYYLLFFLSISLVLALSIFKFLKKQKPLAKAKLLAKVPLFGIVYKEYNSAFFALEWGKLFDQGMEIKTVIDLMQLSTQDSLFSELSRAIEKQSVLGYSFYEQLPAFPFFAPELALIIQQGEVKGNLGKELLLYSELCWERFFTKIERTIQWIQPLIFLVVALLVVSIYAAMLLPIYGGMEEFL